MKLVEFSFFWLLPAAACCCMVGCNNRGTNVGRKSNLPRETDMGHETRTDKSIPPELLDPEFLQSLSIAVSFDHERLEVKPQPLTFPAGSPEAKRACKLLLWLASREDVEPLSLGYREVLSLGMSFDSGPRRTAEFVVWCEPSAGGAVEILARPKSDGGVVEGLELVRHYVCDEKTVEEVTKFWEACSRQARAKRGP